MTEPHHFHTSRLRIEALSLRHASVIFSAQLDPLIYQFIPDDPLSLEELTRRYSFLEGAKSPDGKEHWLNWVAFDREGHAVIGTFQATVPANGPTSIAYTVFPPFWGQGYATEIGLCMLAHIFNTYSSSSVIAEIDTRNTASIRLVERWGFCKSKLTHNADFFKGASSDEYTYSLTLSTWLRTHHSPNHPKIN